jgi:hypothetical protein
VTALAGVTAHKILMKVMRQEHLNENKDLKVF